MEKLPLRPNVCMLVMNKDKEIFIGERFNENGVWQFPQGGVEPELSLEENVLKELEEELGARQSLFKIVKRFKHIHDYDFRRVPRYAVGKWRGQSQTFWLVEFLGNDSDIKLDTAMPEFSQYRWCSIDEIRKTAEPIRMPGYEPVLREFAQFMEGGR